MEVFLPLVVYTKGLFGIDAQKFEIEGDHNPALVFLN